MQKHYEIYGDEDIRMISIPVNKMHMYRFFFYKDNVKTRVKFKRIGGYCYGYALNSVYVYTKPKAHEFHYEVMKHNARSLWLGMKPDFERLQNNMLDFYEIV